MASPESRGFCVKTPTPSDASISQAVTPLKIPEVAKQCGLLDEEVEWYGHYKAKVSYDTLKRLGDKKNGHYVVVTGINPTPAGEGKSTTSVGLCQALGAHCGVTSFCNVRQPSMGPTFGIKGGAAGGGYAQVIPMDEFNLHLTGDIHAIGAAHNLVAAAVDTRAFHESYQTDEALFKYMFPVTRGKRTFAPGMRKRLARLNINKEDPDDMTEEERVKFCRLNIDRSTISWNRVLDVNDRFLRQITIGQGPLEKGLTRETNFEITVASEIMAVLALAVSLADMENRFGRMVVARDTNGDAVTCDDLGVTGAIMALMRDALKPTLMQTLEGTPVFVHAGPFANIAHGNSSVMADLIALKLVGEEGVVVTEAGFGSDMGFEKFCNIKCRASGLRPDAAVIVATVRSLKMHGGGPKWAPGKAMPKEYTEENLELLKAGVVNLQHHVKNCLRFGVPVVVAINRFNFDTDAELALVRESALAAGAQGVEACTHYAEGGKGAVALANTLLAVLKQQPMPFKYTYEDGATIKDKLATICKTVYGADDVEFSEKAEADIENCTRLGFAHLPICMAKTQYSLSHSADLLGVPTGFRVPINEVRVSAGAGFLIGMAGPLPRIPGLPTRPAYYNITVDTETGKIDGMF